MTARLTRLITGLALFGSSLAMMIEAELGLGPWDVFHQGVADRLGVQICWVVIAVGAVALMAWIPLGERPGIGTIANVVLVGLVMNAAIGVLPTPDALPVRIGMLAAGIVVNGVATGLYIGAGLGPGPRDGLMTGIACRGHSVRVVRTGIELSVLAIGLALGGTVGVGTVAFALAIGPLVHVFLPLLTATTDSVATIDVDAAR